MAVWKPENCILTLKGEAVLNKLVFGAEKLTITRVVTGGSFTPFPQLYKLESIPDERQELKVYDITEHDTGSSIKVECSNADLKEAYSIYQLGVYATHPSIEGEFLYWIGECEKDTADFLPLASELPVNLTFGIFLYNLSTSDITIKIEYVNYVTKDFLSKSLRKTGSILGTSDSNQIILKNADNEELSRTALMYVSVDEMKRMFT